MWNCTTDARVFNKRNNMQYKHMKSTSKSVRDVTAGGRVRQGGEAQAREWGRSANYSRAALALCERRNPR